MRLSANFPRNTAPLLFACLLLLNVAQARAQAPPDPAAKIDEYMNAVTKTEGFSGAILVARDGRVVASKGYGMADAEHDVPNTPETKFRIGSLTKQFTAAAVLLLQERGKLSVQDSVCKHVEPCPEAWRPVTIHHLLSHTSGIQSYTSLAEYRKTMREPTTVETLVGRFRERPLDFKPGEGWRYSNSGYVLLGHVVERASGVSYERFLRENIFDPLGMTSTGYDRPDLLLKRRARGYAPGRDGLVNAPYLDMSVPFSAGALYSTTGDLYLWDQALYTERLLKRPSLDAMFTPVRENYGYGLSIDRLFNRRMMGHDGGINGFASCIFRLPDDRATVIVLSNNEAARAVPVAADLAAILFGEKYDVPVERKVAKVDPKVYDAYVGVYELAPDFHITITREGDRLTGQATGQTKLELLPESETKFFVPPVRAQITFARDAAGLVTHLVLDQGGRQQQAKKIK